MAFGGKTKVFLGQDVQYYHGIYCIILKFANQFCNSSSKMTYWWQNSKYPPDEILWAIFALAERLSTSATLAWAKMAIFGSKWHILGERLVKMKGYEIR